ncbi:MAG: FHA domain-containing protein [Sedimentisphaerales bacterium]|nr:FHA domain-containing protein [Sedimentisphaerales bacterium]
MGASLVLVKKDGNRKNFPLATGITLMGRYPNCDLCIPLQEISRRHCQINIHNGLFSLRDLGSSNGTFVNSERIKETPLRPGDHIQVGQITFIFEVNTKTAPKTPSTSAAQPAKTEKISDDDFFASIENIEGLKSGSATDFFAEP